MRERLQRWATGTLMGLALSAGTGLGGVAWASSERFLAAAECATLKADHKQLADGPAGKHFEAGAEAAVALKPEERDQVRELIRLSEQLAFRCAPEKPRPLKPVPQQNPDKQAGAGVLTTGSIASDAPGEPDRQTKPKAIVKPAVQTAAPIVAVMPQANEETMFAPPPDWAKSNN